MPRAGTAKAAASDVAGASVTTTLHMPPPANGAAKPELAIAEEPISIWEKMLAVPKDEWSNNAIVYVYRLGHQTRALATGQKGYLDVLAEPITPDYIKRRWGGGRFRIMLIRNGTMSAKAEEDIEGDPIFEHNERTNGNGAASAPAADNAALLKIFEDQMRAMREQITGLQTALQNKTPEAGTDRVLDMVTKGADKAIEIAGGKAAGTQANPIEQFNAVLAAAKEIAAMRQPAAAPTSGFDKLVELLAPVIPELLKRALSPTSPLDEITKAVPLIELFDKFRGKNDAIPVDSKTAMVQALSENAPNILKTWDDVSARNAKAAEDRRAAEEARLRSIELYAKLTPWQREELRRGGRGREYIHEAAAAPTAVREEPPAARPVNTAPAAAAPATGQEITQEQFDAMVKNTVVQMVVSGANPETVGDYLLSTKPDVCQLISKNPNATIKLFFQGDPVLAVLVKHVTQTPDGPEDFDALLDAVREYIVACEESDKEPAAAPN